MIRTSEADPLSARRTALLVGVLGALLAYLWLFEVQPRRRGAAPAPEAPALLEESSAAVVRIELAEDGRRLTAVRGEGGWTDGEGRPWRGDVVGDLVATLGTLRPLMIVDADPREPADYGLAAGARRLEVVGADGSTLLALELGERNPAWTGVYARRAGRREVMLVGAVLAWELEKVRRAAPAQ